MTEINDTKDKKHGPPTKEQAGSIALAKGERTPSQRDDDTESEIEDLGEEVKLL